MRLFIWQHYAHLMRQIRRERKTQIVQAGRRSAHRLQRSNGAVTVWPAANSATNKVQLTAPGYCVATGGLLNWCFVGDDDELVVASSQSDHRLFIWFVPEWRGNGAFNQLALLSLTRNRYVIKHVRKCKATSSLVTKMVFNQTVDTVQYQPLGRRRRFEWHYNLNSIVFSV